MFSKLKNFSEDLAKTINQDLMAGENGGNWVGNGGNNVINQRRQAAAINDLKNGDKVLHTETPSSSDLTQPTDEPEPVVTENKDAGSESPTPDTGVDGVQGGAGTPQGTPISGSGTATPTPVASTPIDIESLPTGIRSKMKKFAKYEEKYPILLDAYKTEKRKTDLIGQFERILQEHTPVSKISEAGALVEYFNGLTEKTNMLNLEFRKLSAENSSLTREKMRLETLLESETKLKIALINEAQSKDQKIKELESKIVVLEEAEKEEKGGNDEELTELKAKYSSMEEKLNESEQKVHSSEKELEDVNKKVVLAEERALEAEERAESATKKIAVAEAAERKANEEAERETLQLKTEIASLKEKVEEFASKKDILDAGKEAKADVTVSSPQNKAKGNKKKNYKKAGKANATSEPEITSKSEPASNSEVLELQTKYDKLVAEYDELNTKYLSTRNDLSLKNDDLEDLRDLLKNIGNDLVKARDEIKELKSKSNPAEADVAAKIALSDENKVLSEINEELKAKIDNTTNELTQLQKSHQYISSEHQTLKESSKVLESKIDLLNKEVDILNQEKSTLNTRIGELSKFKSNDSSLKLEISSLKVTISHKDTKITELSNKIEELSTQRDQQQQTIDTLKSGLQELQYNNKNLINEKSELITKQELSFERAQLLSNELSKLQTEKHKIKVELDNIKSEHELLIKQKSTSSDEVQIYKQQYLELSMKSKESIAKVESLEDELNEARNVLQERTRESSSIRRALLDLEDQNNSKALELKNEMKKWKEEKFEIENNFNGLMKRRQRELEEGKLIASNYLLKILELEHKCNELKIQQDELKENSFNGKSIMIQLNGTDETIEDIQQTIETLRNSLQVSTKRAKEFESLNNVLKKLNEEANQKFERLSKNYKIVTQQYKDAKEDAHRRLSTSSTSSSTDNISGSNHNNQANGASATTTTTGRDANIGGSQENVAYLKNVLLGYFEHREQRDQLLPVLKMLFKFSPEDEVKFTQAVK